MGVAGCVMKLAIKHMYCEA